MSIKREISIFKLLRFFIFINSLSLLVLLRPIRLFSIYPNQFAINESITTSIYPFSIPKVYKDSNKLQKIKEEFKFAWKKYKKYCWGYSELLPIQLECRNNIDGLTIVDSLSTLFIMGLYEEFNYSRDYLKTKYKFNGTWSTFETVIRFLGGFLSAYQLSNDPFFLNISKQLGSEIYELFDKNTGQICLEAKFETDNEGKISAECIGGYGGALAEQGSMQLEFMTLAELTNDPKYIELSTRLYRHLWTKFPGKVGIVDVNQSNTSDIIRITGGTDSYYEYIIKSYILTGRTSSKLLEKHMKYLSMIKEKAIGKINNITILHDYDDGKIVYRIRHLATFYAGTIATGSVKENSEWKNDLKIAEELTHGYYKLYNLFMTGLGPDMFDYDLEDGKYIITFWSESYVLRPETVESIYLLWKFTGKDIYRQYNWEIFKRIVKYCKISNGYVGVHNVNGSRLRLKVMESYFLAETLKYLYLTFQDNDFIHPDEWIFNTEAHPLRIWDQKTAQKWKKYLDLSDIP